MNDMIVLPIESVIKESKAVTSLVFNHPLDSKPGQFVMLWLPRVDEKPISISYNDGKKFVLSISAVGPFSKAVSKMKPGDKLGIRGPFGTHYPLNPTHTKIAVVGGGYGSAPMACLANEAMKKGMTVYFIEGARSKDLILFVDRMEKAGANVLLATNDGSMGRKGYCTEILKDLMKQVKIDCIYTCGPEHMMKSVVDISDEHDVPCYVSVERYMKCGFGICGQCSVDDLGIRMCKEGPCMTKELAKRIKEFGQYHRDNVGRRVK